MKIRANSNSKFLRRFLLIAAVCFGYLLWASYDIVITSPKGMKKTNEYWVEAEEDGVKVWKQRHSGEEWTRILKENHWPVGAPKTPPAAAGFLYFNCALAFVCLIGGGLATHKFLRANNTWIELEGDQFQTSWGEAFGVNEIQSIDKKRWERKGVAQIAYSSQGARNVFVLDDFKYMRDETDEILYQIEQQLSDEQIINGKRELSAEAKAEEKRLAEEKRRELDVVDED